ncbi:DUF4199 domain-containing protein [Pontibacter sp. 13R65]|uniref:DUF4199 domain-containing protein n=1 Tax=Pontibacter sp. 13R65 TaxID=3127458 RepID=UPI00301C015F
MEKTGLKYGIFTALALVAYFLLMKLLGLAHIIELRFLNGLILAGGIVMAIKNYKQSVDGMIRYFKGLGVGTITAITATVLFAVFMLLYIKLFDTKMLEVLSAERYFGERMTVTPGVVIFMVLMVEGLISGFLISFIAMQYFKRQDHKVPGSP